MNTTTKNLILFPLNLLHRISPAATLKILFRLKMGHKLDLKNPKTYNEKLQCVKLNYKHPLLTKLVDKYTVREFVEQINPDLLPKLWWQGFDANEIPWDDLPDRFVLKVTHGSGYNIICTDKSKLDREDCIRKLNKWRKEKFLRCYGEWFYGVEKPRIIVEEFLDAGEGKVPADYKILCFDGQPHYVILNTDRFGDHRQNIYDVNWNHVENVDLGYPHGAPVEKPEQWEELVACAKQLSAGFPHVRVDLYLVQGKVYFGEMTFTYNAGLTRFTRSFDEHLGDLFPLRKE